MKKLVFLLICVSAFFSVYAQESIEKISNKIAVEFKKEIPKSENNKILVLPFLTEDGKKTELGIRLANSIADNLSAILNKKDEIEILNPKLSSGIRNASEMYFIPPSKQSDESELRVKMQLKNTPTLFISGTFSVDVSTKQLKISNLNLSPNNYSGDATDLKTLAIKSFTINLETDEELIFLKKLSIGLQEESDYYNQLMLLQGNYDKLFSFNISPIKQEDNLNANFLELKIGKSYTIEVNVHEDCYLFAFYYMPDDKQHPYIMPLYPYKQNQKNSDLFKKNKKYFLPTSSGITIEPPIGASVFILVGISNKNLYLDFDSHKDEDGYTYTKLSQKSTKLFIEQLKQEIEQTNKIDLKSIALDTKN